MSDLKVVALEPQEKKPFSIRALDGRYRCLVRIQSFVGTAVLCQAKLSPSRDWIFLGDFYSDQFLRHWRNVEEIEVIEVLAKIDVDGPPPPQPWWKRLLGKALTR